MSLIFVLYKALKTRTVVTVFLRIPVVPCDLVTGAVVSKTSANTQADLSLRSVHMPSCWFCHEAAHIPLEPHHEKNLFYVLFERLRHRSTCTFVQSDQHLCCLLLR